MILIRTSLDGIEGVALVNQSLRHRLECLAEPDYQAFSSRLLPKGTPLLGVRLPLLRKIARELARKDWHFYLDTASNDSFEEILLQGMVIGYADMPVDERQSRTVVFVPKIDNWSVCDSFCSGLKAVHEHPESWWSFLQPYLASQQTYAVRFGVVMLLLYFIDEDHLSAVLSLLGRVECREPAARTAVSWAAAECYIRFPDLTEAFLLGGNLELPVLRGTLQKILESHRISNGDRDRIRLWRNSLSKERDTGFRYSISV